MDARELRCFVGAAILTGLAACATTRGDPGGPLDGPLPPGTYELASDVTYRADSDQMKHEAHASFRARLYVSIDGTTELYSGQDKCVDPRTLPAYRPRREWQGGNPGHHFSCGNSNWTLWANHQGELLGRLSTTVTEMLQSRMKCLTWNFDSGHQVCEEYGVEVHPQSRTVTSTVAVTKVGGQ